MPEITLNTFSGTMEARYSPNENQSEKVALFLHPHPSHGGTMNNKVIYNAFKVFSNRGFSTLRFNFPGVGKSDGTFSGGENELSDAACCLDWLLNQNFSPNNIYIVGYSFGGWVASELIARRPEINNFVLIAPAVDFSSNDTKRLDFSSIENTSSNGLIIHPSDDEIIPVEKVDNLYNRYLSKNNDTNIQYSKVDNCGHFFKNKGLEDCIDLIKTYLDDKQFKL